MTTLASIAESLKITCYDPQFISILDKTLVAKREFLLEPDGTVSVHKDRDGWQKVGQLEQDEFVPSYHSPDPVASTMFRLYHNNLRHSSHSDFMEVKHFNLPF